MGKALQIRVSAVTWNEDLPEKLWPQLFELAFSVPHKHAKKGVLEMVSCLHDGIQFMPWSEVRRENLGPGITKAKQLAQALEDALANWDPRLANTLSDDLEDVLASLEKNFR